MHRSCFLVCLLLLGSALSAQTAANRGAAAEPAVPPGVDLRDPQALLSFATGVNSLDGATMAPWHLKASYESFADTGASLDQGTFEEWRVAPDQWKRTYTSGHFNQTEYGTPAGITTAAAPPWPVSLIARELIHPMPGSNDLDGTTPELRPLAEKSATMNCVMLALPLQKAKWPLGALPTYCFNANLPMLRLEVINGSVQASRNQIALFRHTYIAKEIELSDGGRPLLRIHLQSLASMTPEEVMGLGMPAASKVLDEKPASRLITVASGVAAKNRRGGPNPRYSEEARLSRKQGTVVLQATIGTDGRIHHVRVVSSPDDLLTLASVAAVQRWVYEPYTLNGKLVNVRTTINLVFNLRA